MNASPSRRRRIAVHETGHLVMALILGLDVRRCAIRGHDDDWRPGELGRCTVLVPDPVGLRRFLVSMGGVMAEEHFFGEERGGARDRQDALRALNDFLAHYRERGRTEEVEALFSSVAGFFHHPSVLGILEETARHLEQHRVLEPRDIADLAGHFAPEGDLADLRERLALLEEPVPSPAWKETLLEVLLKARELILRFRKPFDEGP